MTTMASNPNFSKITQPFYTLKYSKESPLN